MTPATQRLDLELTLLPKTPRLIIGAGLVLSLAAHLTVHLYAPPQIRQLLRVAVTAAMLGYLPSVRRQAIKIRRADLYLAAPAADRAFVANFPTREFFVLCLMMLDAALLAALPGFPAPFYAGLGVFSLAVLCWFIPQSVRFQRIARRAFPDIEGL
jgi:hypothetical protein